MEIPSKRAAMETLLETGSAFVYLDPRAPGVEVPARFRGQPQVVLQFGLNLAVPIRDLEGDDAGVRGTLSFNRTPFLCIIPWSAVYALVGDDGRGSVFLETVPPEIRREIDGAPTDLGLSDDDDDDPSMTTRDDRPPLLTDPESESESVGGDAARGGPTATVIPLWPRGVRAERTSTPPKRPPDGGPKPRPPHLRRVK